MERLDKYFDGYFDKKKEQLALNVLSNNIWIRKFGIILELEKFNICVSILHGKEGKVKFN